MRITAYRLVKALTLQATDGYRSLNIDRFMGIPPALPIPTALMPVLLHHR